MSDYTELKRLAEAALRNWPDSKLFERPECERFIDAARPDVVLALIAENERLKKDRRTEHQSLRSDKARNNLYMVIATSLIDDHPYERTGSDWNYEHPIHDKIISLLADRDQLKTENNEFRRRAGSMNLGGFGDAFYKVAECLGVTGARPDSPMQVFASEIYPALEVAIKNAGRYEWLRNGASVILNKEVGFTAESGAKIYSTMPSQRELDSAIDAAISQGEMQ